jgi:ribose transport system permease protein
MPGTETQPTVKPAKSARPGIQTLFATLGMLPVLVVICVGFALLNDRFATLANLTIVAQQASINMVLGAGMTFVILTGGIDLSVGSILAASAMVTMLTSLSSTFGLLALPAGLIFGLLLGVMNGSLIAFMRLPPFIVTLGSLTAVRGLARLLGGDTSVFNPNLGFAVIGSGSIFGVPYLVLIAIGVVIVSWLILRRTVLGVRIYAVGGNPQAARLAGMNVPAVLLFVYGASGVLAAVGGLMAVSRIFAANGLQLGQSYELDAIAAVILGGTSFVGGVGSIWGTVVGVLIIAVLSNGLTLVGVSDVWQFIIKGLVIVGAVMLDRFRLESGART